MNTENLVQALARHPSLQNVPMDEIRPHAERLIGELREAGGDEAMADLLTEKAIEEIAATHQANQTEAAIAKVKSEYPES